MKKYRECKFCDNPEVEGEIILPKGVKISKEVLKLAGGCLGKLHGFSGGSKLGELIADGEIMGISHFYGRAKFHFYCDECGYEWDEDMPC